MITANAETVRGEKQTSLAEIAGTLGHTFTICPDTFTHDFLLAVGYDLNIIAKALEVNDELEISMAVEAVGRRVAFAREFIDELRAAHVKEEA